MLEKIYGMLLSEDMEITERLFRILLLVGTMAVLLAILQGLTLVNAGELMFIYIIMLVVFVVAFILTFKYRNINASAAIIGVPMLFIALPVIFFMGGGINSGSAVWLCLGIFYIFLMFHGKTRLFFLIATVVIDIGCYIQAYFHPEYITELATRFEVHFDSIFAVLTVGITGGLVLDFQVRLFKRERMANEQKQETLEVLSKSKDNFFASMSHEIRTPINSIVGLNELILRENPSEDIQEYAKHIQDASKMLLSLVNDILDLSQMEAQRMSLIEGEYETRELFRELLDIMQVRMDEKQLKFLVDIDSTLPSKLIGDERRIKQILLNILSNAVKYTNEGSVTLSCSYKEAEDGKINLVVSVADTGIGIRTEELENLFDAFMRLDTQKTRKIEGTGLGLSIAKHLTDLMNGTIHVDSIYTQGSLFTVTIPQTVADGTAMGNFWQEETVSNVGVYYSKSFEAPEARILIVDDDDLNLIITTKLLQETKMSIDTASNAEECLKKTKKRFYNLIFMDYMMPGMDGGEVLRAVRRQENGMCKDTPVVMLSANVYGDKYEEYMQMGFQGVLEKPIDAARLEEEALKFIPEDLIEYRRDTNTGGQIEGFVSRLLTKKRKRIQIISDSLCDLSNELVEKMDLRIIDLYIQTKNGRFRDSQEIDVNNMSHYLSEKESFAFSFAPSVKDYEYFFANYLTEAEDVIYISASDKVGKCYTNAMLAAKGFAHVHVIDSEKISCGQGILTLCAADMAKNGATVEEIKIAVEHLKKKVEASFIIPSIKILRDRGMVDSVTAKICEVCRFHPVLGHFGGRITVLGVRMGRLENSWKNYIHYHIRNMSRCSGEVVFIVQAGLSVQQIRMIEEEIRRKYKFKHIITMTASASNICNVGLGTIGIGLIRK